MFATTRRSSSPRRRLVGLALVLIALAIAVAAQAGRALTVGASESAGLVPDPVLAKARMDLAVLAGLKEIEVRAAWTRGETAPGSDELARLQAAAGAAQLDGVRLIDLDRRQSELFYPDDTPKSDLEAVKRTAEAAHAGTLTYRARRR